MAELLAGALGSPQFIDEQLAAWKLE